MKLSKREQQVCELLVIGQTSKGISYDLDLSVHTVNQYIRSIYRKLEVNSRGACVRKLVLGADSEGGSRMKEAEGGVRV